MRIHAIGLEPSLDALLMKLSSDGQRGRYQIVQFNWVFTERKYRRMYNAWKWSLCNLRPRQALISLRMRAGWSGLSLPAYRINGIVECRRTENIQIKLHGSARSSESSLFAHGIRSIFPRCASGTFSHVAACCSRRRSMYHYFIPGKNKTARQTIHMKCQTLFSSKRQNK